MQNKEPIGEGTNTYDVILTEEQAIALCNYYGKNLAELVEYQVGGLVDKLIEENT